MLRSLLRLDSIDHAATHEITFPMSKPLRNLCPRPAGVAGMEHIDGFWLAVCQVEIAHAFGKLSRPGRRTSTPSEAGRPPWSRSHGQPHGLGTHYGCDTSSKHRPEVFHSESMPVVAQDAEQPSWQSTSRMAGSTNRQQDIWVFRRPDCN